MSRDDDIQELILAVHALTRMAALETRNEAPAAQWRTLKLLRDHGPQRLGDLARLSRVSQPGATRLAGQLADAGLVARSADPQDSRASVVSITDAGGAALDAWLAQLNGAMGPLLADLDDAEWAAVRVAASALARRTNAGSVR